MGREGRRRGGEDVFEIFYWNEMIPVLCSDGGTCNRYIHVHVQCTLAGHGYRFVLNSIFGS